MGEQQSTKNGGDENLTVLIPMKRRRVDFNKQVIHFQNH